MTAVFDYILKPPDGYKKLKKRRALLVVLYIVIALGGIGTAILTWQYGLFFPTVALAVGIDIFAIVFTWKKTKPEYEYLIEAGEFSFSAIYGGRSRRTLLTLDLADVAEVDGACHPQTHAALVAACVGVIIVAVVINDHSALCPLQ